jgi:hypothetical protein
MRSLNTHTRDGGLLIEQVIFVPTRTNPGDGQPSRSARSFDISCEFVLSSNLKALAETLAIV